MSSLNKALATTKGRVYAGLLVVAVALGAYIQFGTGTDSPSRKPTGLNATPGAATAPSSTVPTVTAPTTVPAEWTDPARNLFTKADGGIVTRG